MSKKDQKSTADDDDEKYHEWLKQYMYHPGFDLFDNKYLDHIINLNNIIEDECYHESLNIYHKGNEGTLRRFLIDMNPRLMENFMRVAENALAAEEKEKETGDSEEEEEFHLTDNRYKLNVAKKHSAATVTDDT